MKRFIFLFVAVACSITAFAQNNLTVILKNTESKEPLIGATVTITDLKKALSTNAQGEVTFSDIPDGIHSIEYRYIGYTSKVDTLTFPLANTQPLIVLLEEAEGKELEQVVVTSTRSSRTIANIPTRVEVISGEELGEKASMKPGDIRMLLAESTGIQTQQTSATSGNAAIRIQGLDGKYTQIIRDGFPLYSGFSGGLGLLQVAPLDLKQVEVIKGSSSTLYGGGAIAGLVNLVSKTPTDERQLDFLLNGTSAKGLDASVFYGEKFNKVGTTIYAAYNHGSPYDPSSVGLTAIPRFNRYTINPKLWVYLNERTTLNVGINATVENRIGGDLDYIEGRGSTQHSYFEQNKTGRYS
ncbi:MAG: TonB-dependent receptor, partial [Pedobacter sp.]